MIGVIIGLIVGGLAGMFLMAALALSKGEWAYG